MRQFTIYNLQFTIIIAAIFIALLVPSKIGALAPIGFLPAPPTSCGTGTARSTGLVSTPTLTGNFNTTGACVKDIKAAFAPYKIPTFEGLKSLYFDQAKATSNTSKQDLPAGDKTHSDIPMTGTTNYLYNIKKTSPTSSDGNLIITGNITGNNTGVVFVEGNLNIGPISSNKLTYGNNDSGLVFVVKGNVLIDKSVTQIDAVIIAQGTIYTATDSSALISLTPCTRSSVDVGTNALTTNGSLISLSPGTIIFCRNLTDNNNPAEVINQQPKYLVILKDLFADTLQKWSEIQ